VNDAPGASSPLITLTTDFGQDDGYVGAMKGAMLSIAPTARVVDLTHGIRPQDVRSGAYALWQAVPYWPAATVHVAVVDPGVGTNRRGLAIAAGGQLLVGPDNGLLAWAAQRLGAGDLVGDVLRIGEHGQAVALEAPAFWRPAPSSSFHGRDVFGPVAAHLAAGLALHQLGPMVSTIIAMPWPRPEVVDGGWMVEVVHVDRFGNLVTALSRDLLAGRDVVVRVGDRWIAGLSPHYQQDGELIALIGSEGLLEVAAPNGSAASTSGLGVGACLQVLLRD